MDEDPEFERVLRDALVGEIVANRLTPDDLAGKLYRLSPWRVLYIALGLTLVLGIGVVAPVWALFTMSFLGFVAVTCLFWYVLWVPFQNVREAIAEHFVYSWCAKRDIPRIMWIRQRDELMLQMPQRTRWFAQYVDPPQFHE